MKWALIVVSYLAVVGASLSAAQTPAQVVTTVLKLDKGTDLLSAEPNRAMRRHFTRAFVNAWRAALKFNEDVPFMDGDAISGYQTVKSLTLKNLNVDASNPSRVVVTASVFVDSETPETEDIRFTLLQEAGAWKIDDVGNNFDHSLHAYLDKCSNAAC